MNKYIRFSFTKAAHQDSPKLEIDCFVDVTKKLIESVNGDFDFIQVTLVARKIENMGIRVERNE